MKSINFAGCQGDVGFFRVPRVPEGFAVRAPEGDKHIIAFSETSHHHVIDAADVVRFEGPDPLVAYLRLEGDAADVVHQRSYDTHGTVRLSGGKGAVWEVRRQREYDPAGERRAAD